MADIQLDVASANRFISSLSKSLQALCHGCMDFDAGIEIVGYINVNIDSGSKVDYVLNEKVLKSTTNSMTFVSNSFLAQKEQPKTSKDGSCSPIPELNYPQPRNHGNYSYPATQLYRSSGIYSPHSQVVRGSQKRQWPSSDWRMSPRKFARGAKSQYPSSYQQQHSSTSQNESYSSYSNQQTPNTSSSAISSQQSLSTSQQEYDSSGADQSHADVNIKKEVEDGTSESAAGGGSTDQANAAENVNIKSDPDAAPALDTSENVPPKSETDISDSFLQQPTKDDNTSDPNNTGSNQDNDGANYDPTYSESYGESGDQGEGGDNSNAAIDSQGQSGADTNYEESGEMFSESYSGEGTSGGGQFEVIEIDDDDEDVAAMFDETQRNRQNPDRPLSDHFRYNLCEIMKQTCVADNRSYNPVLCPHCSFECRSSTALKHHIIQHHRDQIPFNCNQCGRGFMTQSGLKLHEESHGERKFICSVCDNRFKLKHHLKSHMKLIHKMKLCAYCSCWFAFLDFDTHVASCHSYS